MDTCESSVKYFFNCTAHLTPSAWQRLVINNTALTRAQRQLRFYISKFKQRLCPFETYKMHSYRPSEGIYFERSRYRSIIQSSAAPSAHKRGSNRCLYTLILNTQQLQLLFF